VPFLKDWFPELRAAVNTLPPMQKLTAKEEAHVRMCKRVLVTKVAELWGVIQQVENKWKVWYGIDNTIEENVNDAWLRRREWWTLKGLVEDAEKLIEGVNVD